MQNEHIIDKYITKVLEIKMHRILTASEALDSMNKMTHERELQRKEYENRYPSSFIPYTKRQIDKLPTREEIATKMSNMLEERKRQSDEFIKKYKQGYHPSI